VLRMAPFLALQDVVIDHCCIYDISPVGSLSNLRRFQLSRVDTIRDLWGLATSPSLETLLVTECREIQDIAPVMTLPTMKLLSVDRCPNVLGSSLRVRNNLEELTLSGCRFLRDVSWISHCDRLIKLVLSQSIALEDIEPLAFLPNITSLDLSFAGTYLEHVYFLRSLPHLTELNLSGCSGVWEVEPLAKAPVLSHLNISRCELVHQIAELSRSTSLKTLDISGCKGIPEYEVSALLIGSPSIRLIGSKSWIVSSSSDWDDGTSSEHDDDEEHHQHEAAAVGTAGDTAPGTR